MIDKYKRPRVQRLVPWRNPPAGPNNANEWARDMARRILAHCHSCRMADVSGAMPGDYCRWELRADCQ